MRENKEQKLVWKMNERKEKWKKKKLIGKMNERKLKWKTGYGKWMKEKRSSTSKIRKKTISEMKERQIWMITNQKNGRKMKENW